MPGRHRKPRPAGRRAAATVGLTALFGGGLAVAADQANAAAPTISLDPSDAFTLGGAGTLFVTATVDRDVPEAADKIAFLLYGPSDPLCTGMPINSVDEVVLNAAPDPQAVLSAAVPAAGAGTYRWRVQYTDASTPADNVLTPCSDAASTVVAKATPTLATNPSAPITLGAGSITDSVTITGLMAPALTGTVGFKAYTNDTCTGTPALTVAPVNYMGGPLATPAQQANNAGNYRWVVSYSGDANYEAVTSPCAAANQSVVNRTAPTISTTAGADLGKGRLTDTATLTGLINASGGSVTFSAYGPANETCAGTPAFTSAKPVPAGVSPATVVSDGFRPAEAGTYRWTASYGGDANNGPVAGKCSDPGETTIVTAVPVSDGNGGSGGNGGNGGSGVTCLGYKATMVYGNGNDTITGTNGRDVIVAGGGDDIVYGNGGDDVICGGDGDDAIDGGDDNDLLYGGDDNDTIVGGDDGDVLLGGNDADDLRGGNGDDALAGNGGDDVLDGGSGSDDCQGGAGTDSLTSC